MKTTAFPARRAAQRCAFSLMVLLAAIVADACDTGGSGGECAPGDTRECTGPGACRGGQSCDSDQMWGACNCGDAGRSGGRAGSDGGAVPPNSLSGEGARCGAEVSGAGGASAAASGPDETQYDGGVSPYHCTPPEPEGSTGLLGDGLPCCDTVTSPVGVCTRECALSSPALTSTLGRSLCTAGSRCAPRPDATGYAEPCTAHLGVALGLEGRCLPKCFVKRHPLRASLTREGCASPDAVCAPCFDPVDGSNTGACEMKPGDEPKYPAPAPWAPCGSTTPGRTEGVCVPKAFVATFAPAQFSLERHECPETAVCVPLAKADNADACFPRCKIGFDGPARYVAGVCVPAFVADDVATGSAAWFKSGSCTGAGEICMPCLLKPKDDAGRPTYLCD